MPLALNVALIGYGYAGRTFHAPLIAATPGLALHTIVSSDPAKVHADLPEARVLPVAEQAFADPAIDLVVIATPDPLHAPQATAALRAGKHVVVDKPFAPTLAEAQAVVAEAERAGRVLSVFHNRRWDSDHLTLRRLIERGALGEIVHYESHFDRFRPQILDRWRERPGAGLWRDLGPHLIDQALQLFGPPVSIQADVHRQRPGALAPDWFHVLLRYDRLRVILHASVLTPVPGPRLVVHGTRGSFHKHGLDPQEDALKAGARPGAPGWGVDPSPGTLSLAGEGGAVREAPFDPIPGDYPAFYAGVRDCIAGIAPNPVPPSEALAVMRLLEAADPRPALAM
jgi:predicted dehydrogenase